MLYQTGMIIFWLLFGLIALTTLAPLTDSQQWWIRGWDFPRVHIVITCMVAVILGLFVWRFDVAFAVAIIATCGLYQGYRIFPYTQLAATEIDLQPLTPAEERISLISANVLMSNEDHAAVTAMIGREQPDVLFLMETDQKWVDALSDPLSSYETVLSYPLDNHYGLIFATRLKVHDTQIRFLADDTTPTVPADL